MDKEAIIKLREIKAVDFFDALDTGDFKKVAENEEEFYDILDSYNDITNRKISGSDLVIHQLKVRIVSIMNLKNLLLLNGWDEEIGEKLKELGFDVSEDNFEEKVPEFEKYIAKYNKKLNEAKQRKPEVEEDKKLNDIYFMMSDISISAGFDFDYEDINLLKFITLVKALEKKSAKNE